MAVVKGLNRRGAQMTSPCLAPARTRNQSVKKILWNIFNVLETPPLNIAGLAKDWQYFENCGIESHNWEWAISESFQTSVN